MELLLFSRKVVLFDGGVYNSSVSLGEDRLCWKIESRDCCAEISFMDEYDLLVDEEPDFCCLLFP